MALTVRFQTHIEDKPGESWKALFDRSWPSYRAWFLRSGTVGRPSFLESRRALRTHMPEMVPTWERLVELAGGGDLEARFLSLWCPPAYIAGCSQAIWVDPKGNEPPALLRNYDFAPLLLEGNWLATRWGHRRVVALGDCLWGALDGLNEAGVAASLSFGGRTVVGEGFGIPLVLRHVLEQATCTREAVKLLERAPVNMTYSVTVLDSKGDWATVYVAPDRPAEVNRRQSLTNFQHAVEWPQHAEATKSVERAAALEQQTGKARTSQDAIAALLSPPLFQTLYSRGYGTLYTAAYRPSSGVVELHWPSQNWVQSVEGFTEGHREVAYADGVDARPLGAAR